MKTTLRVLFIKLLAITLFIFIGSTAQAQLSASIPFNSSHSDTSAKLISAVPFNYSEKEEEKSRAFDFLSAEISESTDRQLQKNISLKLSKRQERKLLMDYFKQLEVNDRLSGNQANKKVYYRFANLFARLKLYPLAMKFFLKTLEQEKPKTDPGTGSANLKNVDINADLPINDKDDSLVTQQAELVRNEKSKRTSYNQILTFFNNSKTAVAYAMLFHVKQPVAGKRKVFVFSNTGHTFITLIKYYADSTYVSCSFGFYPKKDHPLSATPVYPSSSSQFKNDAGHQWDEVVGKFISKKKFDRIINLTKNYENLEYHLSKNNCTDFCLQAATMAGINIANTKGKWPLGSGNNPGVTGQSLLNGTFSNADAANTASDLFSTLNLSVLP